MKVLHPLPGPPVQPSNARFLIVLLLLLLLPTRDAGAYSVLSHEEVVDMAWLTTIVPMLHTRFPGLSDDDIVKAHAYAYGGSVIQDIGYYPFGSKYFSDLLHYVRTGDFVSALIRESKDANEYAFALGALAHYCGDVYGHPAINRATADEFPKLAGQFGPVVTYDENNTAHLRTEFGFDVVEVARGRYSQKAYRDFIGFQVSKSLLERAFQETYGIPMDSVMTHEDLAIATYRRAVSTLIPQMTEVAVVSYKKQIQKEDPNFDKAKFVYRLRRTEFEKEYGTQYIHPGLRTRFVAFMVEHLPKIGPLKALKLSIPNAAEQDIYVKSVNTTVDHYKLYLGAVIPPTALVPGLAPPAYPVAPVKLLAPPDLKGATANAAAPSHVAGSGPDHPSAPSPDPPIVVPTPAPPLPATVAVSPRDATLGAPDSELVQSQRAPDLHEVDLDTGKPSRFGEYRLADYTYAHLLDQVLHAKDPITPDLQQSLKDFYDGPRTEPAWYFKNPKGWQTLQADLAAFAALPITPSPTPTVPSGIPAPAPSQPAAAAVKPSRSSL
jgi:hypothetical protein